MSRKTVCHIDRPFLRRSVAHFKELDIQNNWVLEKYPKQYFSFNEVTRKWEIQINNLKKLGEFEKKSEEEILIFLENSQFLIEFLTLKNRDSDAFNADRTVTNLM